MNVKGLNDMSRFADVPTNTRHGPRPVPEHHIPTRDAPIDPPASREPKSLRTTLMVWGGLGLAATVGVLAARAAADALSARAEDKASPPPTQRPAPYQGPRPRHAPAYAALDEERRARMRAHARADMADFDEHAAELRARAQRERRKRRAPAAPQQKSAGFAENIGTAARSVVALIGAATAALEGFKQVSANSDQIMRDFSSAADKLQQFLGVRGADKDSAKDTDAAEAADSATQKHAEGDARSAEDKRSRSL